MELITYPFSMGVGAVFVLWLLSPWAILSFFAAQNWSKWLTDGKYEIGKTVEKRYEALPDWLGGGVPVTGGIATILFCIITLIYWGRHTDTFLEALVHVNYVIPVEVAVWLTPVLLPIVIVFLGSFGMRKLFRVGVFNQRPIN